MQFRIAYITYGGTLKYSSANNFNETTDLLPFLQNKGLDIAAEIWDDPNVNWEQYDIALLKTPWDYHEKYEEFKRWLDKIESLGIKLLNDLGTVRWNMDKHYLSDIANAGFDIIPSLFIHRGWTGDLQTWFEKLDSDELIIKPCVSGGSRDTLALKSTQATVDRDRVHDLISRGDFIVQPLMPQIREGEWSFIFFNGSYSHTVVKKPRSGDFRVQQIFGGSIETVSPDQEQIELAASYVSKFAQDTLYARVDGLMVDGRFVLMELELIEPFLYLSYDAGAVDRYSDALTEQLALALGG